MWMTEPAYTFSSPMSLGDIEEKASEECGQRRDYEACLYYKLIYEPIGSGEIMILY